MAAKHENGKNATVPGLILSSEEEVRRFCNCLKQIASKKEKNLHTEILDSPSPEGLSVLDSYNVRLKIA